MNIILKILHKKMRFSLLFICTSSISTMQTHACNWVAFGSLTPLQKLHLPLLTPTPQPNQPLCFAPQPSAEHPHAPTFPSQKLFSLLHWVFGNFHHCLSANNGEGHVHYQSTLDMFPHLMLWKKPYKRPSHFTAILRGASHYGHWSRGRWIPTTWLLGSKILFVGLSH